MDAITDIFDALGGPTAIANATGDPVQTVHSWKVNNSIPRWRRPPLLKLTPVEGKSLTPAALAYLTSAATPTRPDQQAHAA